MVSTLSWRALSMKPQVFTMSTSASSGTLQTWNWWAASWPSITSLSTRFLGQPSDTIPILTAWLIISS